MKVSRFFDRYDLNHTGIEKIEDLYSQGLVVIHIELCNWIQTFYQEGQPEFVSGRMILSGVGSFVASPSLSTLEFGEHADGEVISFGYVPERDSLDLEAGEIVMRWVDYYTRIYTVVILSFLAKDAEWIPT